MQHAITRFSVSFGLFLVRHRSDSDDTPVLTPAQQWKMLKKEIKDDLKENKQNRLEKREKSGGAAIQDTFQSKKVEPSSLYYCSV